MKSIVVLPLVIGNGECTHIEKFVHLMLTHYSLPPYFVVPESIADQALYHVARQHHGNRLPVSHCDYV